MAKKSGGYNKTQMKALQKNIDNEISKFSKALKAAATDLETLQKGDGTVSYWSGERAYAWIKNALAHLDHDKVLLDHLDGCNEYLEALIHGGSAL